MRYPKELFSINVTLTQANLREYDRKKDNWYKAAHKLYPNYSSMSMREQMAVWKEIDDYVGYQMWNGGRYAERLRAERLRKEVK